ncbi:SIR2 family protein, partial [Microbacterium maritypicum]|uniref:SIR2 family protein n=3 Tax=Microbacterium maritypicum TaxID=33918 RepID=UPI00166535E9
IRNLLSRHPSRLTHTKTNQLDQHALVAEVPLRSGALPSGSLASWREVAEALDAGRGLEETLLTVSVPEDLAVVVTEAIADCVLAAEQRAIAGVLTDTSISAFGRLMLFALQGTPALDVVTTNYDRLVEVHAARAGVRVDSTFYGHTVGRFDPLLSREELLQMQRSSGRGRKSSVSQRAHIRLSKPHGSLDWYSRDNQHYRSDLPLGGSRRIVAPGGNKYRLGYEVPFDVHRARANEAIDKASALLFIGYGFNDDHLQTHIVERIAHVPTVIVSKELTDQAHEHLKLNSSAVGIESGVDTNESRVTRGLNSITVEKPLWDLEHLVKEVLAS